MRFKFLGIGKRYHYIVYRIPQWLDDGSFLVRWALVDSVDHSYFELYGSWYLKQFIIAGKPYTYIRNFAQTGFIDPSGLLGTVQDMFGKQGTRKFFEGIYNSAEQS